MPLPGMSFPIWRIMNVVAIAACALGAIQALSARPATIGSMTTGITSSFLMSILLLVGRRVPRKTAERVVAIGLLVGLPFVFFVVLPGIVLRSVEMFGMALGLLLFVGWSSLTVAAFQSTRPLLSNPDRPSNIDHLLSDLPEHASERH
jgi:hypothetical protein